MSEDVIDTGIVGRWSDEITFPVEIGRSIAYPKATNGDRAASRRQSRPSGVVNSAGILRDSFA
jgi:hypothetical protein